MRELKNLEDTIEKLNKTEALKTKTIVESTKSERNAKEKEKIIKINELEEDLRVEIVKRRMKEKAVSFRN